MKSVFRIKGKVLDREGRSVEGLSIKVYDDKGVFIGGGSTGENGHVDFDFESVTSPKTIKFIHNRKIIATKKVADIGIDDGIVDFGSLDIWLIPPAEWHIKGFVKDKMSGDPLQGLTIEVFDEDTSVSGGPYYDPLGEDFTDAAGEFNVWFDGSVFEREATWSGEVNPDVLIKVKNSQGVVIYEAAVDQNVLGSPHPCPSYLAHKGKEYVIEIDYVTVAINTVAFVDVVNINSTGRATSHAGITDRPFAGYTTIGGRIWGAKVDQWKMYYALGFVDSSDARFSGLGPSSADPTGFTMLAQGTNKVWDGPIHKWTTGNLEGTHTAILVVWDQDGNEYHDTQVLFLHNTAITPPAQITSPAPGNTVSKAAGSTVNIQGNASDDYFWQYALLWAGPTQTELTPANITLSSAGPSQIPVVAGKLGDWDVSKLPEGPYLLRLEVHDRAIRDDDAWTNNDWTWNVFTITA